MSILNTERDEITLAELDFDSEIVTHVATKTKPAATEVVEVSRSAKGPGRLARFIEQGRQRSMSRARDSFLAEPAIYEEYRASLARRNAQREASLRD